jgi:hypothetical protein
MKQRQVGRAKGPAQASRNMGHSCSCASGTLPTEIARLRKRYGRGRWRKRKGIAEIRLGSGEIATAELH